MKFRFFLNCIVIACIFLGCDLVDKKSSDVKFEGQFVYTSEDKNGNSQLYISLTDGVPIKRLTNFSSDDATNPSWSPDGKQIAFVRNYVDPDAPYFKSKENTLSSNSNTLYIIDSNGANMRPLHRDSETGGFLQGYSPTWSSDGKKIAFVDFEYPYFYQNADIYVYDFEKESVTKVTDHQGDDYTSVWSKDDEHLYFISNRDYVDIDSLRNFRDLYKINLQTLEIDRIISLGYYGRVIFNRITEKLLIKGPENNSLRLYDLQSNEEEFIDVNFPTYNRFSIMDAYSNNQYFISTNLPGTSRVRRIEIYNTEDQSLTTLFSTDEISGLDWIDR